jgi:hypothetical protein
MSEWEPRRIFHKNLYFTTDYYGWGRGVKHVNKVYIVNFIYIIKKSFKKGWLAVAAI